MSANAAVDHYEVLGVPAHADTQAIEAAYRAGLARIKASLGGGTPLPAEFFERLREAYQTLMDADERQRYDLERRRQLEAVSQAIAYADPVTETAVDPTPTVVAWTGADSASLAGDLMRLEAGKSLKWLYCLTLVTTIFPTALAGASGWVSLATGGGLLSFGILSLVVWLLAFAYRIVLVVKHPTTLDAYRSTKTVLVLRKFGIFLMIVGLIGALFQLFAGQLAAALFGNSSGNGIAVFVVRMYTYFIASGGLLGLCLFELSRLLGFEAKLRTAS